MQTAQENKDLPQLIHEHAYNYEAYDVKKKELDLLLSKKKTLWEEIETMVKNHHISPQLEGMYAVANRSFKLLEEGDFLLITKAGYNYDHLKATIFNEKGKMLPDQSITFDYLKNIDTVDKKKFFSAYIWCSSAQKSIIGL